MLDCEPITHGTTHVPVAMVRLQELSEDPIERAGCRVILCCSRAIPTTPQPDPNALGRELPVAISDCLLLLELRQ